MNARLDLLAAPSATCSSPAPLGCCSRYQPGCDSAPGLFGGLAVALERGAESTLRFLNRILCCTASSLR